MYAASVPVFQRYLGQLARMVDAGAAQGCDLQARLVPDMLPLGLQIDIATQFSLRACAPLAGLEVPPFGQGSATFADLHARIGRAQAFLAVGKRFWCKIQYRNILVPLGQQVVWGRFDGGEI